MPRNIFTEVKQRAVSWVIILFILSVIFLRPSQRNIFILSEWYPFEICLSHSVSIFEYLLKKFSMCFHLCCDIFLSYRFAGSWQLFDTSRLERVKTFTYLYATSGSKNGAWGSRLFLFQNFISLALKLPTCFIFG